jgi:RNA polymerase sigma-70 factor (ECF subfamily)
MVTDAATTPDEIDDLARRAQDGDRDAMESLLTAVRPRTLNVCRGVLPYSPDAEDACQEALIKVSQKIGSWNQQGRFTTWLHVVAVNSARSTYRRMKGQAIAVDPAESQAMQRPDPRTTSVIAGSRLDFLEALELLSVDHPALVEPLVLRDVQELEYADIATLLDIPVGTVKSRIHSARQIVQPLLTR